MSVTSTDIVAYAPQNVPTADTGTSGGAIETTAKTRLTFVDTTNSPANSIECKSTSGSDTMDITVVGRNTGGTIVSETEALTGTTFIALSTLGSVERILSATLASNAVGTVTVRVANAGGTGSIVTQIEPGERGSRIMFYDAASATTGGGSKVRYEKLYIKNNNGSSNLTNATIAMSADPSNVMEWAFATASGQSVTNRLTATSGPTYITDATATQIPAVSGEVATAGVLAASEGSGIWIKQTLVENNAALKSTFTLTVAGTTT